MYSAILYRYSMQDNKYIQNRTIFNIDPNLMKKEQKNNTIGVPFFYKYECFEGEKQLDSIYSVNPFIFD